VNITWCDNYGAWLDLLSGCVAVGDTLDEVKENIKMSVDMHLAGMREDLTPIPAEFQDEYQFDFKLNTQASRHHSTNIVTQVAHAKVGARTFRSRVISRATIE
jgi:predicted RNase H-like HicB family nuclease